MVWFHIFALRVWMFPVNPVVVQYIMPMTSMCVAAPCVNVLACLRVFLSMSEVLENLPKYCTPEKRGSYVLLVPEIRTSYSSLKYRMPCAPAWLDTHGSISLWAFSWNSA